MKSAASIKNWKIELLTGILFWVCTSCVGESGNQETLQLEAYSRIEVEARGETSGIVKSRVHNGVFWIHGDSGNPTKVFPINKNGEIMSSEHSNGVELINNENTDWDEIDMDWEDIAVDDSGNLIVADIGNNDFDRDNLSFLIFPEPNMNQEEISGYQRIQIRYPEKSGKTSEKKLRGKKASTSPDAEAVFYKDGSIYLITKEKGGDDTRLYKLESWDESRTNTLTPVTIYNFDDKVTASDISVTGDSLAVLTSSSAWIFSNFTGDDFFSGSVSKVIFSANQVESITFSGEKSVIISEEEGQLYEIKISEFK